MGTGVWGCNAAWPEHRERQRSRMQGGLVWLLLLVMLLSACGGQGRSVSAVCHVWDTQGLRLRQRYHEDLTGGDLFRSLADVVTAPSALASLASNMAAVAPTSVEPSFSVVAKTLAAERADEPGVLTDPEVVLAKALLRSFEARRAFDQVDHFLSQNCSPTIGS